MPPYLETARAFDGVAGDYDAAYGPDGNAVMTWMRRESLAVLEATFPVGSRLLELGCGTGEEAVHLARAGRTVLATDVSPRMAAITAAKARDAGVDLQGVALPASGIAALHPGTPFDGVYASFGGLNCEPDLGAVARGLERLVRPGGAFVTSVMSRYCLFEVVWYLAHGRPGRAFRRWRRGWQAAPVAGTGDREVSVATRYLTVHALARKFAPVFRVERVWALPLLLPPPYADVWFRKHRDLFRRLEPWERRLRGGWPWRYWGDHLLVVMRRR